MTGADLDLLIHQYFERTLSPEDEASLWTRLREDPAAADRFVELAELESGMLESLQADDDMPSGVYTLVHGTRRRPRPPQIRRGQVVWPYAVAAGLFIAALTLLLRMGGGPAVPPEPSPHGPVARSSDPLRAATAPDRAAAPAPPVRPKEDLEADRLRYQQALQQFDRKEELLEEARKEAVAQERVQTQRDLEQKLVQIEIDRRKEATNLMRVEEALSRPDPTQVAGPAPAGGLIIDSVEGTVVWIGEPEKALQAGQAVPPGAGLETRGPKSLLVLKLDDGSRIELRAESRLEHLQGAAEPKSLTLAQGTLVASIAKQAPSHSIVVWTPHAELTVLGTRFLLEVAPEATRLDLEEGRIRNRRLSDGKVIEVLANHSVTTGRSGPLVAKLLPTVRSFQDGVSPTPEYSGTRDTSISSAAPTTAAGSQDLLRLYRQPGGDLQNTVLLKWDLSSIPPRSRVVSAELSFWVTGGLGGPGARAFEIGRPWEEQEATWKWAKTGVPWQIAGARGEQDGASKTLVTIAPATTGWSTFPVNEAGLLLIQQWINLPRNNFGIGITKEPPNAWDLASREWATPDHRPKLTVITLPPAK
ncbi:MAG TPA: DNRLRE domain-containing protein [Planctomycetota bacterium]|nr:DNRLRE domain-containing protein [Planctomycetota bacterium]